MEFLSRSWSLPAAEISRALLANNKERNFVVDRQPDMIIPENHAVVPQPRHHHQFSSENSSNPKMSAAMASATELLASHCIEMTELAGSNHDRVWWSSAALPLCVVCGLMGTRKPVGGGLRLGVGGGPGEPLRGRRSCRLPRLGRILDRDGIQHRKNSWQGWDSVIQWAVLMLFS